MDGYTIGRESCTSASHTELLAMAMHNAHYIIVHMFSCVVSRIYQVYVVLQHTMAEISGNAVKSIVC